MYTTYDKESDLNEDEISERVFDDEWSSNPELIKFIDFKHGSDEDSIYARAYFPFTGDEPLLFRELYNQLLQYSKTTNIQNQVFVLSDHTAYNKCSKEKTKRIDNKPTSYIDVNYKKLQKTLTTLNSIQNAFKCNKIGKVVYKYLKNTNVFYRDYAGNIMRGNVKDYSKCVIFIMFSRIENNGKPIFGIYTAHEDIDNIMLDKDVMDHRDIVYQFITRGINKFSLSEVKKSGWSFDPIKFDLIYPPTTNYKIDLIKASYKKLVSVYKAITNALPDILMLIFGGPVLLVYYGTIPGFILYHLHKQGHLPWVDVAFNWINNNLLSYFM